MYLVPLASHTLGVRNAVNKLEAEGFSKLFEDIPCKKVATSRPLPVSTQKQTHVPQSNYRAISE